MNLTELFNPNDEFINICNKSNFGLSSYNLGIFNSLSTICKNLNINNYNNKENIFTDSVIRMLLSKEK